MNLNKEQREAVDLHEGHICVVAGAGAGKTALLIERVKRMLEAGISPDNILAFTFTRKAANELRERLSASVGEMSDRIHCGTIHSIFKRILEANLSTVEKMWRSVGVCQKWQTLKFIREIHTDYGYDDEEYADPKSIPGYIGRAKNMGMGPDAWREHLRKADYPLNVIEYYVTCYKEYDRRKRAESLIDFDDMLILSRDLFRDHPEILKQYQEEFRFISVDEYQDINPVQEELIDMLQGGYGNLFVVGDARQCVVGPTPIMTPLGIFMAEDIEQGDMVTSAIGGGEVAGRQVNHVFKRSFSGNLYLVRTKSGANFEATPEHVCFIGAPWDWPGALQLTPGVKYIEESVGALEPGMIVPVLNGGTLSDDLIVSITSRKVENIEVYDFEVEDTHNYLADGICIHNSIYGFRGSEPRYILDFAKKYPDAKIVSLPRNYRCGDMILEKANALIANNEEGIVPMIAEAGIPGKIELLPVALNADEEADIIFEEMSKMKGSYSDMAILYRTNHQSRAIEDVLIKHGIPYEIVGSEGFYGRREIKDMIAYMYLAQEWDELSDRSHFERVYSKPTRYIGRKFLEVWHQRADEGGPISCLMDSWGYPAVARRALPNVHRLYRDLNHLKSLVDHTTSFLMYIMENMGYNDWFVEQEGESAVDNEMEILGNLSELLAAAENFSSVEKFLNYIKEIQRRRSTDDSKDKVTLMTIHRSKGTEYPVVFIAGANEKLMPHSKAESHEEERRLMYVGVTRAKQALKISYFTTMFDKNVGPSPFLSEMALSAADLFLPSTTEEDVLL